MLANAIIRGNLSVREAEKLAKHGVAAKSSTKTPKPKKDSDTRAIETDLGSFLKMGVSIDHKEGSESGKMTLSYKSLDDLDRLCAILMAESK